MTADNQPPAAGQSRVVVITGGTSGIGLTAALHYATEGWKVGLIARGKPALDAALLEVLRAGGLGHIAIADVSNGAALEAAAAELEAALGRSTFGSTMPVSDSTAPSWTCRTRRSGGS